jgi:hypothetical protein
MGRTMRAARTLLCIAPLFAVSESPSQEAVDGGSRIDEAREHFAAFADHPAVGLTEQLFRQMSYSPMNYLALLHSEFPEAREIRRLPDYLPTDEGSKAMLARYVGLVRDFYEVSGFESFWDAHESRVAAVLETARANIRAPGLPRMMEEFYGREAGRQRRVKETSST